MPINPIPMLLAISCLGLSLAGGAGIYSDVQQRQRIEALESQVLQLATATNDLATLVVRLSNEKTGSARRDADCMLARSPLEISLGESRVRL